jgi:CubicO group peptidase (beta-lactamase class C family)
MHRTLVAVLSILAPILLLTPLCDACRPQASAAEGSVEPLVIPRWHPHDFAFPGPRETPNPFEVDFAGQITQPDGTTYTAVGFHDGDATWKLRLAPQVEGLHRLVTRSNMPSLDGLTAEFRGARNDDPHCHGGLRVSLDHPRHFVCEDGTHYFLLGYECDWLWALDMADPRPPVLGTFLDKLHHHGFNHVIINTYAHDTSWRPGQSERRDYGPPPAFPWEGTNEAPRHERFNVSYWRHYDQVIDSLFRRGMAAHVMLKVYNKRVCWPKKGSELDDRFFRWVVARYAAYPNVVWDFSKEAHNEKDVDYKLSRLKLLRESDPYRRLITVHDDNRLYDSGAYDQLVDFRCDQEHKDLAATLAAQRRQRSWPIANVEFGYEHGLAGPQDKTYRVAQSPEEFCRRAWQVSMAGGYTAYYYTNTAWDVIHADETPPGYRLFGLLREFFERTRYWRLEPRSDLVSQGACLAEVGHEYVVFQPSPTEFSLRISDHEKSETEKPWAAEWFDPFSGRRIPGGTVLGGETSFMPPGNWGESPAVLHLYYDAQDRSGSRRPRFPGVTWEHLPAEALGLQGQVLEELSGELQGRGCVVRDGVVVHAWGDQSQKSDWKSAAKPVLSTLLWFAVQEGKVQGVDQPIADFGWELTPKDRGITFRHLGGMTSGYARPEGPGEAWAYNDFAIQLYQKTLFDLVFHDDPQRAAMDTNRFGALQLEDGLQFREPNRRLHASVRDFARIAWFWLQQGRWRERQLLDEQLFQDLMQPQVPVSLPRTRAADTADYLAIGSFGGGSDHFAGHGQGIYGFNWWFNRPVGPEQAEKTWPDAPDDTVMAIGAGGNCAVLIPSLDLMLINAQGNWGPLRPGDRQSAMNRYLGRLVAAAHDKSGP